MLSKDNALRGLQLAVGMLSGLLTGIDLSFNVYAVDMKQRLNFTQTQIELVASMGSIGFGLTFLETIITSTCGYIATFIVSWLALTGSGALYACVAVYADFFHQWPVLVYLIQLTLSIGSGLTCMVVSRLCLEVISNRSMGTFIGVFGAATCLGKIVIAGLFDLVFHKDLAKLFLCLSALFAVVIGACYILMYPVAAHLSRQQQQQYDDTQDERIPILCERERSSLKQMLYSPFFHLSFWSATLFSSMGYSVLNNITSITKSIGMTNTFEIVTTMSVCIILTGSLYGPIYDKCSSRACGYWLLFSSYASLLMALLLGMYFLDTRTVYAMTVLCGLSLGPSFTLPMAMLVLTYGASRYSLIAGLLNASAAISQFFIQMIIGYLYDREVIVDVDGQHLCYGKHCFFWTYVLLLSVTLIVCLLQGINYFITVGIFKSKSTKNIPR